VNPEIVIGEPTTKTKASGPFGTLERVDITEPANGSKAGVSQEPA